MAENLPEQSRQEVLEAEIQRLSAEIQKYKELPEAHVLTGQELVKKSIQATVPVPTPPSAPAPSPKPAGGKLPDYAADAPAEARLEIESLVDMALYHGLDKANAEAMKTSPFIMDAFHDALAAKLYPELQKRGVLK